VTESTHEVDTGATGWDGGADRLSEGSVPAEDDRRAALMASLPQTDESTPLASQLAIDARRRIDLQGRRFPRPTATRIITVANQKGGVGKTTTTVNIAAGLAQAGLNVLVIDNDPQGNASTALGVDHRAGTPSIYEVLVDGSPLESAVQQCPDIPTLWCVPATIDLSGAEIELVSMVSRETRLRRALDVYLEQRVAAGLDPIDYVLVDCPPSLGLLTINAFVVGREVLIPIQCEYYALEGLSQLLKTIELIKAHLNPGLHVSTILLTMYDGRTNLAQQVASEVREHFPDQTLRTTVPRSVRISEAPSHGQTVMTYDAGSTGALAYLEAARELTQRAPGVVAPLDPSQNGRSMDVSTAGQQLEADVDADRGSEPAPSAGRPATSLSEHGGVDSLDHRADNPEHGVDNPEHTITSPDDSSGSSQRADEAREQREDGSEHGAGSVTDAEDVDGVRMTRNEHEFAASIGGPAVRLEEQR
jgi:chromosome partitioning protein